MSSPAGATLFAHVDRLLAGAFAACGLEAEGVRAVPAQRPELGDLQCNAIMPLAGRLKRPPRELAEAVVAKLGALDDFADVNVAGPGFINLRLSNSLLSYFAGTQAAAPRGGVLPQSPETIVIDFGGPNVAKPLHVGHLRSLVLGESLRRILQA
jgi:arginyl-tRNA synthetase